MKLLNNPLPNLKGPHPPLEKLSLKQTLISIRKKKKLLSLLPNLLKGSPHPLKRPKKYPMRIQVQKPMKTKQPLIHHHLRKRRVLLMTTVAMTKRKRRNPLPKLPLSRLLLRKKKVQMMKVVAMMKRRRNPLQKLPLPRLRPRKKKVQMMTVAMMKRMKNQPPLNQQKRQQQRKKRAQTMTVAMTKRMKNQPLSQLPKLPPRKKRRVQMTMIAVMTIAAMMMIMTRKLKLPSQLQNPLPKRRKKVPLTKKTVVRMRKRRNQLPR